MSNFFIHIDNKYQLDLRLGVGGYGEVFQGHDLKTGHEVALKFEKNDLYPHLINEIDVYDALQGGRGIPQMYWHGEVSEFVVIALSLLGPSLEDLFQYCGGKFSLKTVLMLADQLIPVLRYIHSKGYIHRDIKPQNILMGDGKQGSTVFVADLGTAKEFDETGKISGMAGTRRFAPISAHLYVEQVPRDDLEALGYNLLHFLRGSLPWRDLKDESMEDDVVLAESKKFAEDNELFKDVPDEFKKYFKHIHSLRSGQKPDYAYLRRLFSNLFRRKGFRYDYVFDWTELKFLEVIEEEKQKREVERQRTIDVLNASTLLPQMNYSLQ